MSQNKITVIGGGNIGKSLVKGLIGAKKYDPKNITITRRKLSALDDMSVMGVNTTNDNAAAAADAQVVVLAVLPQQFDTVMEQLGSQLSKDQLLISVISGVTIEDVRSKTNATVVRAMPNTAIAINESMTCIAGDANSKKRIDEVEDIFNTVGTCMKIEEEHMTAATALCACGIAFFLRAIRAASQGGIEIGFHADEALHMAAQTAMGAAGLLVHHEKHPEREIDKVTSPEGCTIAGLNEMEHQGFSSALIKGIITSAKKAGGLYSDN